MDGLSVAASVIAVVDLSAKIASLCFQYSKDVNSAEEDIKRLSQEVTNLKTISEKAEKLIDSPHGSRLGCSYELKGAVEESLSKLQRLEQELQVGTRVGKTRKVMSRVGFRALKWPFKSKDIEKTIQDLVRCTQAISSALQVDETAVVLKIDQRSVLDQLPVAEGASFDSYAEEHGPTCLADTRVELLREISEWIGNPNAKAMFWLNGMAGTGKSTISRTLAHSVSKTGSLGASFFFKRGEADRGNLSRFFTTIACQLIVREPPLVPLIMDAIETDPNVLRAGVRQQFQKLIIDPLSAIHYASLNGAPFVFIIDALDECENEDDIRLLINLFSSTQVTQSSKLKIFITSRPDLPIRLGFSNVEGTYQDIVLHDIPLPVIEHDISAFLQYKLAQIRDDYNATVTKERRLSPNWPDQPSTLALVNMAIPLFIFATTACRFISERKRGNPESQLRKVLEYQGKSTTSRLDATYLPVLNQQIVDLPPRERDEVAQQFRQIIGSIIILASPLSTSTLARLLDVTQDSIYTRLDMLHSVFKVPPSADSPVRLLHLSFRDYLVDSASREKTPLWVDEKHTHREMVDNCLRVLHKHLRKDICDIQDPGAPRSTICSQRIDDCLPPEACYACLHWIYHVQQAMICLDDGGKVHAFLTHYFLYWIEALSLLGRVQESLGLIGNLQLLVQSQNSKQISDFLGDAKRFILTNVSVIDSMPLQLYSSTLAYAPERSKVRTTFKDEMAPWIRMTPKVESDWNPCLQALRGHKGAINSAVFSHDSALIASGSSDNTVRVWRASTGEYLQTLEGHRRPITSVAFSNDSVLIASASYDRTVRIWHSSTGEYRTLKGHNEGVKSVAFSHNSTLIASGSNDDTVRIWLTKMGECLQILKGHSAGVLSVAFSNDSTLIVSGSNDYTARIWCSSTGECLRVFEGHSYWVSSVTFSHDSALIASASTDETVRIWRVSTGECLQVLKGHGDWVSSVAFSHNSAIIASASKDKTVHIWHPTKGQCLQILKGHSSNVNSVVFSKDSGLIVSASEDETVRIWRPNIEEQIQTLEGHSDWITLTALSPDLTLLASGSDDGTVRIWHISTGECLKTLEIPAPLSSVAFSHNSALIALASRDRMVRIWRVNTGECAQTFEGSDQVLSLAFSHNSGLIALADREVVRIWHPDASKYLQPLVGHSGYIRSVAYSHDSTLIATGSNDESVRIWCTTSNQGKCLRKLEGHSERLESVVFSQDSELVVSYSRDETVRTWRVSTGECIQCIDSHIVSYYLCIRASITGAIDKRTTIHSSSDLRSHVLPTSRSAFGISQDRCWISVGGKNIFWLPEEFRPQYSTILGSTVILCSFLGRVTVLGFSNKMLPEALWNT